MGLCGWMVRFLCKWKGGDGKGRRPTRAGRRWACFTLYAPTFGGVAGSDGPAWSQAWHKPGAQQAWAAALALVECALAGP